MRKSYGEGVATHTDPESCGAACEGGVEALTGARAGRVLSRVSTFLRDADAVGESGRLHLEHRDREMLEGPARSETPCTYGNTSHENREVLCLPSTTGNVEGRVGKSKDVRRR
jgi:RNA-directed DNA polymerase